MSQFEFLSFGTIWVSDFCHSLSFFKFFILSQYKFFCCHNELSWVSSQFWFCKYLIFFSFLTSFEIGHYLSCWVLSKKYNFCVFFVTIRFFLLHYNFFVTVFFFFWNKVSCEHMCLGKKKKKLLKKKKMWNKFTHEI